MSNNEMSARTTRTLRIGGWSLIAFLLLLPAVAMQFTREVQWGAEDFLFAALVFGTAGGLLELAARASADLAYRIAAFVTVLGCFLIIWVSLAVGIIGESDNPRNIVYFAVVGMIATGAVAARGDAQGLKRAMMWMTGVQLLVALMHVGPARMAVPIDLFLAALWAASAALFAKASKPASSA